MIHCITENVYGLNFQANFEIYQVRSKLTIVYASEGVSNRWTGIWNGTMEWKMEWNNEHTQLQFTCITGAAQSRSNYVPSGCYLIAEAL